MKMYVVMANDFPDEVFHSPVVADNYVKTKNEEQKEGGRRIYYRSYEFTVKDHA